MNNNYNILYTLEMNTLIIFHVIRDYNTLSKISRFLNLLWRTVYLQLKKLEKLKLINSSKSGRERIYSYSLQGSELFKHFDKFLNEINKTEGEIL